MGNKLSFQIDIIEWDGKIVSLKKDKDIIDSLRILSAAGIKQTMFGGIHFEEKNSFKHNVGAKKIKKLLDDEGFSLSSYHCIFPTFAPLSSNQDEVLDVMKKTVDFVQEMSPEVLVIHPGRIAGKHTSSQTIWEKFLSAEKDFGKASIIDTIASNFSYMADLIPNTKIALESMGYFEPLGSVNDLPKIIKKINKDNVGYCLDSGHAHAFGESIPEWIQIMNDKLFETHFHDNHGRGISLLKEKEFMKPVKGIDEHLPVGFGTIPWIEVVNALKQIDYQHTISFETSGWIMDDPTKGFKYAIAWWNAMIALSTKGK